MDSGHHYIGEELDLFAKAKNWKAYLSKNITPLLGTEVLEVGAGMGTNTMFLCPGQHRHWLCVEPDSTLLARLAQRIDQCADFSPVQTRLGTIESIHDESFDTILYIDVLEHIEDDKSELEIASRLLRPAGMLVVAAPAHQWLYSPFDKAVGHFRRYTKKTLAAVGPPHLKLEQLHYIDSAGLLASIGNLIFLRRSLPSIKQIQFWDSWLIPIAIRLDSWLRYRVGRTIVGVWKKG
jgi:ubiquinone/menaquinone biosynthesis C-methylase UbiE